ncbi:fatty acyl-CoA reductase 1-like [Oryza brachyantha]|uniref:Fatty acyl-CoA reductase n=1 Tax=Oryza brachyantha TaxID=4533 RepID=J3LX00_ORYBR|nr:fatty acyl-CoA reductase 1-like [Oryza brachyantha]
MAGRSIAESFRGRTLLITGSTGFLAKMLVEKILRVQPNVRKLYLLVRAPDAAAAEQRVLNEVVEKSLFDVLREEHGAAGFHSFIKNKICPLAGDVVHENFGLGSSEIQQLKQEVEIIVNAAATTNFMERYDVALETNTLGVVHLCQFANRCDNLKMLLHVSTAYVAGEQAGLLLEKPFQMGEALRKGYHLDIEAELQLVDWTKSELRMKSSSDKISEKTTMKKLGIKRANHFGWPNTYVLTKAMGEMLLGQLGRDLPVVIARPSMITSTIQEPMPGWIEGTRTVDAMFVAYNDQTVPCFIADDNVLFDLIPGDMVINAMMAAIASHWNERSQVIYHMSSAHQNPLSSSFIEESAYIYFDKNPRTGKDGKIVENKKILMFKRFSYFHAYMVLRYKLPLEIMHVVSMLLGGLYSKNYSKLNRGYNFLMTVAKFYAPYVFFRGCFDDTNLRKLWKWTAMDQNDASAFNFDPNCINWSSYLINTHIPAALKYDAENRKAKSVQ